MFNRALIMHVWIWRAWSTTAHSALWRVEGTWKDMCTWYPDTTSRAGELKLDPQGILHVLKDTKDHNTWAL
jgi:hypothetical protein